MTITQSNLKDYRDCGVYTITHDASGKVYVGSSSVVYKRKSRHFVSLKKNKHTNSHLQSAYNKYGAEAFTFKIVIACPPEDRIFHEQRLIDQYQSADRKFGYNKSATAGVMTPCEQTRKKMSDARLGVSPWNKGKKHSKESIEKMRISHLGKGCGPRGPMSEETKKILSDQRLGKKLPDLWRKNISQALKGKNTWSRGCKLSKEHVEKLISIKKNKTHCRRGHEYSGENLIFKKGNRRCKKCHKEKRKIREANKRAGVSLL